jgi:hypothetical protein
VGVILGIFKATFSVSRVLQKKVEFQNSSRCEPTASHKVLSVIDQMERCSLLSP